MRAHIYVAANTVWAFFQSHKDRLSKEMVVIAENKDTEYAVYLTEDNALPLFSVCKGDAKPEYEECVLTETGCNEAAKRLYAQYLFPVMIVDGKKCPPEYTSTTRVTRLTAAQNQRPCPATSGSRPVMPVRNMNAPGMPATHTRRHNCW